MTAIAVVVVSVGGRGAAATSVMSEVTSVIFEVTFEAISVMTFETTSDAIVVAKATADATVLAWRATAVTRGDLWTRWPRERRALRRRLLVRGRGERGRQRLSPSVRAQRDGNRARY